jgi:hypothetical protein
MRTLATIILGGAGLLAAGAAVAAGADKAHVMNVALPDGSVARIHDVGDVAPKVMVAPAVPVLTPVRLEKAEASPRLQRPSEANGKGRVRGSRPFLSHPA